MCIVIIVFTDNNKVTTGYDNKAFLDDDDNAPLTSHNTSESYWSV